MRYSDFSAATKILIDNYCVAHNLTRSEVVSRFNELFDGGKCLTRHSTFDMKTPADR